MAIAADAFVEEAVRAVDLAALMVPTEEKDVLAVAELQGGQVGECLDAEEAAIDVVPKEEVSVVLDAPRNAEELEDVVKLPVEIAANRDWESDLKESWLLVKDVRQLRKQQGQLRLTEVPAAADLRNPGVNIHPAQCPQYLIGTASISPMSGGQRPEESGRRFD
jgi:hypothetical protein